MAKLIVFNNVTLDGYFTDNNGDMSWAHKQDSEWNEFVAGNASGESRLIFGRVTYQMMASFWPTPQASASFPEVAQRMNSLQKVVFSRSMDAAAWQNTKLVKSGIEEEVRKLKDDAGPDMTILGSGTIVSQLAEAGLIDEFHVVVNPIAIGQGRTMFEGMSRKVHLKLLRTRSFGNGNVLLCYEPMV